MMTELRVGDRVSWHTRDYSALDPRRGGDGTIAGMTSDKLTIETVCFPPGEIQRLTFRWAEVTVARRPD